MIKEMVNVAEECIRVPRHRSVWSSEQQKYVCPEYERQNVVAQHSQAVTVEETERHPPIGSHFKLVFLPAAVGTLVFVLFCFVCSLAAGRQPPPLLEQVILGFFDLAKIGFGAIVGLLGGKAIRA